MATTRTITRNQTRRITVRSGGRTRTVPVRVKTTVKVTRRR